MIWSDAGVVISCKKYGEKYKIVNIFTQAHGNVAGMISHQKTHPLVVFSCVDVSWSSNREGALGFWSVQKEKQNWIFSMNNQASVIASQSICLLLDKILPLGVCYQILFEFVEYFASNMYEFSSLEVLNLYAYFELLLLTSVGYGIDTKKCSICGKKEDLHYISPKTGRGASRLCIPYDCFDKLFKIPEVWQLWQNNDFSRINKEEIKNSLNITGHFIEKNIIRNENYFRDSMVAMLAA